MQDNVTANVPSDPYLMTGYDKKVLHLANSSPFQVTVTVQVDFLGCAGHPGCLDWQTFQQVTVQPNAYAYIAFPDGFSAHWVRLVSSQSAVLTAFFHYT